MSNYAEFHALKMTLRNNVADNDVAVVYDNNSPNSSNSPFNSQTLDVKSVPAGVYILRVTDTDGKEYHRKIVRYNGFQDM